ncbi:hypothetical protein, partial [uncultured Methanofollis sp.]|uniref:hypothetical protein n=1 Tax=uncultured Methanofollis sp. TaxID=262500 RepID=UPI00261F0818
RTGEIRREGQNGASGGNRTGSGRTQRPLAAGMIAGNDFPFSAPHGAGEREGVMPEIALIRNPEAIPGSTLYRASPA